MGGVSDSGFVPAVCDNGHVFRPRAYHLADRAQLQKATPTRTGTCPHCGAAGTIRAGNYALVNGVAERTGDLSQG